MAHPAVSAAERAQAKAIVEDAARRYIAERQAKVPLFCAEHFSVRGAWRINRQAFGHDLWRAPANVLWAGPYLLSRGISRLGRRLGWHRGAAWLERLRPGVRTAVAQEVEWLIYTELLELPIALPDRSSSRDALLDTILAHEGVAGLVLPELQRLQSQAAAAGTREKLEQFLSTYAGSRHAANELAGSLLSLAAGAAAFHQFTPGAMAIGSATATALAQQIAVAHFALGTTLGSLYYSLFPATASAGLMASAVGGIMALLGVATAFTGIVTDPLQQALGLHERRLHRLLEALEHQLTGGEADFRLRDAYAARVLDLVDLLRGAVAMLRT